MTPYVLLGTAPGIDAGRVRVSRPAPAGELELLESMTPERARWFGQTLISLADQIESQTGRP